MSSLQKRFRKKIEELQRIGNQMGVDNPLGHYAYREMIMAEYLGHNHKTSKGNNKTSENYGSDAEDPSDGRPCEYKSMSCKSAAQERRILNRESGMVRLNGTYNGAYTEESVRQYRKRGIKHYFSLWNPGITPYAPLAIVRVDAEHVARQLMEGVRKIQESDDGSTNNNKASVKINPATGQFTLGDGEIMYLYDQ
jgi:hypothetical protein